MNLLEIAHRTGVTLADLELLIRGGVPDGVANRLGVPLLSLEQFLTQGYAAAKLAHRLGTSMAAAEALGTAVGPEVRIGIILGLLLSSRQGRAAEAGGR
jgi:hypothetical protein